VFSGVIASVTGFGFFVRLSDLFIDGLVHVSSLDNDYYRYDNIGQRLTGESSGQVYRLGDTVEIRVEAVHMDERKIDFALVSSTRKPRGAGKTERERNKKGGGRTLRESAGAPLRGKRRTGGKTPANFEPDSAFRKKEGAKAEGAVGKAESKDRSKSKKPRSKPAAAAAGTSESKPGNKKAGKPKVVSAKTKKIAAATKAKRAKKKSAEQE